MKNQRSGFLRTCVCASYALVQVSHSETQTIPLSAGMNLVSFTVAPTDPAPSAVFGALGGNFIEAATYENQTKEWRFFRNQSLPDSASLNSIPGLTLGPVTPGKGYLVRVSSAANLTITGTALPSPSVTLYPGMNLVGFPVPSTSPSIIGIQDVLSGPDFHFATAFQWNQPNYQHFTNDGVSNEPYYLFDRNKAYWVESTAATNRLWTPQVLQPPLVYVEQADALIVEAPVPEAPTPVTANVPIRLTRTFAGKIGVLVTGTAHPTTDFSAGTLTPAISPTNSVGELTVNAGANSYLLPLGIMQKPRLQTNCSVIVTLLRPVETPNVKDSGTLPQVAHLKITDGKNGIYDGFLESQASTATLNGQNFRIALRANGQAIFDPGEGGMISSRFSLPYSFVAGVPQFTGSATVSLASSGSLRRAVTVVIKPGNTTLLNSVSSGPPSFELSASLTFSNLTAAGPFHTTAKMTFIQASPGL